MEKEYYSYVECLKDCKVLVPMLQKYQPDALVAIARGGLTLGHLLSEALQMRNLYTLNSIHYEGSCKLESFQISNIPDLSSFSKIVLVDDIVDSGETMVEILKILKERFPHCEFKVATIFTKKTALMQPDFYVKEAKAWIDFFWEVDVL